MIMERFKWAEGEAPRAWPSSYFVTEIVPVRPHRPFSFLLSLSPLIISMREQGEGRDLTVERTTLKAAARGQSPSSRYPVIFTLAIRAKTPLSIPSLFSFSLFPSPPSPPFSIIFVHPPYASRCSHCCTIVSCPQTQSTNRQHTPPKSSKAHAISTLATLTFVTTILSPASKLSSFPLSSLFARSLGHLPSLESPLQPLRFEVDNPSSSVSSSFPNRRSTSASGRHSRSSYS